MSDYPQQRVESARKAAADLRKRLDELPEQQRGAEALAEIAVQLIYLNASMDLVEDALRDVGQNVL